MKEVGEAAMRRSVLSRGDPSKMRKFVRKLESCTDGGGLEEVVTIVVLGGSETAGHGSKWGPQNHEGSSSFLGLPPQILLPVRGGDLNPWANRYYDLLSKAYPLCTIDAMNLAVGGATSVWALNNFQHLFETGGYQATRSGRPLAEVVDLVVLDYSVNDASTSIIDFRGVPKDLWLNKESKRDQHIFLEAISEYVLDYLLKLPTSPAVTIYVTGMYGLDVSASYSEAAAKYNVPVVSMHDVSSFPDSPRFYSPSQYFVWPEDGEAELELVDAPELFSDLGKPRSHNFSVTWGVDRHPITSVHVLMGEVLYFATRMLSVAVDAQQPLACASSKPAAKLTPPDGTTWAAKARRFYDPHVVCPDGVLVFHGAKDDFEAKKLGLPLLGEKTQVDDGVSSDWKLAEDRPDKFGWVIEKASRNATLNTIMFPVKFHYPGGQISFAYLMTYENAGKVEISLKLDSDQMTATVPPLAYTFQKPTKHTLKMADPDGPARLTPGGIKNVTLDSFLPGTKISRYNTRRLYPVGLSPTKPVKLPILVEATLLVRLLPLSADEAAEKRRGNGRFKIVGVGSC